MKTYTVIEKQINDNGQQSLLTQNFTDRNAALSDVFSRLSYAALSNLPYHSAHLIEFDGQNVFISAGMAFDRSPAPEPEPEPEPEQA